MTVVITEERESPTAPPRTRRDTGGRPATRDRCADAGPPWANRIRRRRLQLGVEGWTYERLAAEMRIVAARHGLAELPESLPNMICKWAGGRKLPSHTYRHLLAEAMGVTAEGLGMPVDPNYPQWVYGGRVRAQR